MSKGTKRIPLTQGKFAIVDAADYEWLMQWKWCAWKRRVADGTQVDRPLCIAKLCEIMQSPFGVKTDHKDRDGLNNRRDNLRLATNQQNGQNTAKATAALTSIYRGVSWDAHGQKWRAHIRVGGRQVYLGSFVSEIDAARAYDAAALERGELCPLNFPEDM